MVVSLPLSSADGTMVLGSTGNGELEMYCYGDVAVDRGATVQIDSPGNFFLTENNVTYNLYDEGSEWLHNNVWLVVSNNCWAAVVYESPPDGTWTVEWGTKGTSYTLPSKTWQAVTL